MSFRSGVLFLPLIALATACTPGPAPTAAAPAPTLAPMTKAAFSEELTERTFRYFWDTTDTEKRSEEHTSELQSLMRISYAVFCLKKKNNNINTQRQPYELALDTRKQIEHET